MEDRILQEMMLRQEVEHGKGVQMKGRPLPQPIQGNSG